MTETINQEHGDEVRHARQVDIMFYNPCSRKAVAMNHTGVWA